MKSIWIFKNTREMIISIILFIAFISGFIYIGTKDYTSNKVIDNQKFNKEHKEVKDNDNIFVYIDSSSALDYVKKDNVIVLFGIKNSDWVGYYANVVNEVAKEVGISEIYYYDITEDRKDKNAIYEIIVQYLENYITYLDDQTANIYAPALLIKKNGLIKYFNDDTALIKGKITSSDYWNEYNTDLMKERLKIELVSYLEENIDGEE